MPAHWEVRRLKYLIEGGLTYGANAAAEHKNPEWPRFLRITDFGLDGKLRDDTFRSLPPEIGLACHAGYLIRTRPQSCFLNPRFLFAFTHSSGFASWKDSVFIIATIQNISVEKYANWPVPTPPIEEQEQIVTHLDEATAAIDAAIDNARGQVELMREYRASPIAHVVTGKLDVWAAAAALSPEPAEQEPVGR